MVISETVMSADHKTKRKLYKKIRGFFFFFFFFFFLLSKCQLRSSCTHLLHLHETRNVHENLSVCVCACVRMYVYKGCCNINDTGAGRSDREITAKSDAKIL